MNLTRIIDKHLSVLLQQFRTVLPERLLSIEYNGMSCIVTAYNSKISYYVTCTWNQGCSDFSVRYNPNNSILSNKIGTDIALKLEAPLKKFFSSEYNILNISNSKILLTEEPVYSFHTSDGNFLNIPIMQLESSKEQLLMF
jgi:hypothetical protein